MKTPHRHIPSTMVSQHPDHAHKPYWHNKAFISTRHETKELFLSFSDLGVDEYKWDWEGKLVDESVIERALAEHYEFFKDKQLGKQKFLTFRLPNPRVESEFRLGRAFMGILSAASLAKQAGFEQPPIFEVILPMTENAKEMIEIQSAFREMASLKHPLFKFSDSGMTHVELIPLFEDVNTIIQSAKIVDEYLELHQKQFGFLPPYLRPYVARSDPALNSGLVPTLLAIKVALSGYAELAKKRKIDLYPIIGSASLPFRGGLTPFTVEQFAKEYSGVRTALIQSAFRYDYDHTDAQQGVAKLATLLPQGEATHVSAAEAEKINQVIALFEPAYQSTIEQIADTINALSNQLPKRRERVQHIGLFGYSRGVGKVKLPRAIGFTAALYSLGIPPELIGTGRGLALAKEQGLVEVVEKWYLNLRLDLIQAGKYLNKKNLKKLAKQSEAWQGVVEDIAAIENYLGTKLGPHSEDQQKHERITSSILQGFDKKISLTKLIEKAAKLRKSMG